MFEKMTIEQYNQILASDAPTPGGGSALALVGACGCSLIKMAVEITLNKLQQKDIDPDDWQTNNAIASLTNSKSLLDRSTKKMFDESNLDADAFKGILNAMRLPKDTDENKKLRTASIQKQYHKAALVPLELMATCSYVINQIQPLVPHMYAYVVSDAEIGISLLKSVIENSIKNVYANTNLIKDERLREQLEAQAKGYLM